MLTSEGWSDRSVPLTDRQGSQDPPRYTPAVLPSSLVYQKGLGARSAGQLPFLSAGLSQGELRAAARLPDQPTALSLAQPPFYF